MQRLNSETRGGSWSHWWLVVVLALGVGVVSYVVAAVGVEPQSQAIVGLSDDVTPAFFAQERDLTIERALEAGLTIAIASEVTLEIVPADDDLTRILVNAKGPDPSAIIEEANRVADGTVALSEQAARSHLDDELARLGQLELARVDERDRAQLNLSAAIAAGETDATASADLVRLDEQVRSLESRISEIQAEQAELESRGIRSSAVLISRAREAAESSSSPLRIGIVGALVGALVGLVLGAVGTARPKTPPLADFRKESEPSGVAAGPKRRFEAPRQGLVPSVIARGAEDPEQLHAPASEAKQGFDDPREVNTVSVKGVDTEDSEPLDEKTTDASLAVSFLKKRFEDNTPFFAEPTRAEMPGASRYGQRKDPIEPPLGDDSIQTIRYGVDRTVVEDPIGDVIDLTSVAHEEDLASAGEPAVNPTPSSDWPTFDSVLGTMEPLEPLDLDTSRVRELIESVQESLSQD